MNPDEYIRSQLMAGYGVPQHQLGPSSSPSERVILGSVIGFRAWRIVDWSLCGTGVNRAWIPGVNEATCDTGTPTFGVRVPSHHAPAAGCGCGLTALARFSEENSHWLSTDVLGAIEAWSDEGGPAPGRFFLHENGFRAQFAKVVLLATCDQWPAAKKAAVKALANEHGADLCKVKHLSDAAKEHGQLVPDELLRWAKQAPPSGPVEGQTRASFINKLTADFVAQQMTATTTAAPPYFQFPASYVEQWSVRARKGSAPLAGKKPKQRVKQSLGYPGPPSHGKFRRGDAVLDSRGQKWECLKGGKPGTWGWA